MANDLRVVDYELCDLGIDYPDYFQGFGTAFTPFSHCAYGIGDNPREALADVLEQIACEGFDADDLARRIAADECWQLDERGEVLAPTTPRVTSKHGEDAYYHIGIRWTCAAAADHPAPPPCPPPPGHNFKLSDHIIFLDCADSDSDN